MKNRQLVRIARTLIQFSDNRRKMFLNQLDTDTRCRVIEELAALKADGPRNRD